MNNKADMEIDNMISFILLAVGILLLVLLIIGIVDNIDTIGKVIENSLEGLF